MSPRAPRGPALPLAGIAVSLLSWLAAPAAALPCAPPPAARVQDAAKAVPAAPDFASLSKTLDEKRDLVELETLRELANLKTGEAFDALIAGYESVKTNYVKRAILRVLPSFLGVPEQEPRALAKLVELASRGGEKEIAETAVKSIANFREAGHAALAEVIKSKADEDVRELALREHTAGARPEDLAWYRELWKGPEPADDKGRKAPKGPKQKQVEEQDGGTSVTAKLRAVAFEACRAKLPAEELVAVLEGDPVGELRVLALEQLESLGDARAYELGAKIYESSNMPATLRTAAAGVIVRKDGAKALERFVEDAAKTQMPRRLLDALATIVADGLDDGIEKKLGKIVSKGSVEARLFALRALRTGKDAKLDARILDLADEKELELACAAVECLGYRRSNALLGDLDKLLARAKEARLKAEVVATMTKLQRQDAAWHERLLALAQDASLEVRNTAVESLGLLPRAKALPAIHKALGDAQWSTRLAAVRALETLRAEEGVGLLIERLEAEEEGRMPLELAAALERLTGRSFGAFAALWRRWWEREGKDFHLAASGDAPTTYAQPTEVREHGETFVATFFGTRVRSTRVLFIIDISGSMEEPAAGGGTRMERAKRELSDAIRNLGPNTQFNVVVFSFEARAWLERIGQMDPKKIKAKGGFLEQALGFIAKLKSGGGTNLYAALRLAFSDPEVDTVYLLTDGEPTVGEVIDPTAIRERVNLWNKNRKVVLHSIAFGGTFPILEWLAQDSGGSYRYIP